MDISITLSNERERERERESDEGIYSTQQILIFNDFLPCQYT